MKKILTKYCPIILAFAIGFSVCAVAMTNLEPITAYLNHGLTVEFNDVDQIMTDESGNKVIPLTYNNTTYLPIRAVSNMLGIKVNWHQETQTVLLGESYPDEIVQVGLSDEELRKIAFREIQKTCNEDSNCVFSDALAVYNYPDNQNIISVGAFARNIGEISGWNDTVYLDRMTGKVLWHSVGNDVNEGLEAFILKNHLISQEEISKNISISENIADIIMSAYKELEKEYSVDMDVNYDDWGYTFSSIYPNNIENMYAVEFYLHNINFSELNSLVVVYVNPDTKEVVHIRDCSRDIYQEDINFWDTYGFEHK